MDSNEEAVVVDAQNNDTEDTQDTISLSKAEYEKLNQDLGSLKRELKDLRKSKTQEVETKVVKEDKSDTSPLLEKLERMALRQAGITDPEDMDLARSTAKKWGVDIDEVLMDEDFKLKLERQQTKRENTLATSKIRGGTGTSQAKNTPEYWVAKGVPPTPTDVPDRATRAKIINSLLGNAKVGKKFYNE